MPDLSLEFSTLRTPCAPGTLYSHCPWLCVPDPPELEALFADSPVLAIPAHVNHDFGREPFVWWIDAGILATYAERADGSRIVEIFTKGALLGAPKAMLHRESCMRLSCRMLSPMRVRRTDASRFRSFLAEHPETEAEWWKRLALSHTAMIDGLLINGLEQVPVRLAHLFVVLASLAGQGAQLNSQEGTLLPIGPTADELALMTHATRAVISRQLSAWARGGLIERRGRRILLAPDFADRTLGLRMGRSAP